MREVLEIVIELGGMSYADGSTREGHGVGQFCVVGLSVVSGGEVGNQQVGAPKTGRINGKNIHARLHYPLDYRGVDRPSSGEPVAQPGVRASLASTRV